MNELRFSADAYFSLKANKVRITRVLREFLDLRIVCNGEMPLVSVSRASGGNKRGLYFLSVESSQELELSVENEENCRIGKDEKGKFVECSPSKKNGHSYTFYYGSVDELLNFNCE